MAFENIKIIDCTIRDGGLINNWNFDFDVVRGFYESLSKAGIDYMEIGYKVSKKLFSPSENGKWRFCDENDVLRVVSGIDSNTKLGFMVDIGRVEFEDILPKQSSIFEFVRIAAYDYQIPHAIEMSKYMYEKGYKVFINIMALSQSNLKKITDGLNEINNYEFIEGVYIVDSFGALFPKDIKNYALLYASVLKNTNIGIHAHNNQQLAFANTIEAITNGVTYVDATINDIGRASGNCPLELLLPYLKLDRYDVLPILDSISSIIVNLKQEYQWGYLIPYMLTGILNEHPRNVDDLKEKLDYSEMYKNLTKT